jgi:protocatechuate 3,4-dioxygenase beta subunit
MNRNKFLKNGLLGIGSIVAVPSVLSSCSSDDDALQDNDPNACATSPVETAGPFPIKTPAELVRENIIGNRTGVPLLINFIIQNVNDNCAGLVGALVDIWHCDAQGNYSQYDGQLDGNFTSESFLRGRQTTDANGNASFISIFPGWYPGRTPHIHVEIKSSTGTSLLITQVSWDETISNTVYMVNGYNGNADTNNSNDGIVGVANLADSLIGDTNNGYTLTKTIKVSA